ncbi:MAG: hypothetical protein M1812_007787 [Candelaria pacifica]|nr:MAG: hypothetical protein M1812_007787 [Candelaria pacifica]
MKVTFFHLLTAASVCNLCSVAVARPIEDTHLQETYQDADTDYSGLSRRLIVRNQEENDVEENEDDFENPVLPSSDLSRRFDIPGIAKPKTGDIPSTGSGAGSSVADTPGAQLAGGAAKSDTHIGADTGAVAKTGDVAAGSNPVVNTKNAVCKRWGACTPEAAPQGLTAQQKTFWDNAQDIKKNNPDIGAQDSTKWGKTNEITYTKNYVKGKEGQTRVIDGDLQKELDAPLKQLGIDSKQMLKVTDLHSKKADGGSVMECDMSTSGKNTLIMEMKFKKNDKNAAGDQMPNFVLAKQAMQENKFFVPEVLVQRTVINTDTQRVAQDAKTAVKADKNGYFTLSADAKAGTPEHKFYNLILGTDNVRPSANMLNAFPRYFQDQEIQTIHIWKKNDAVHPISGQFTLAMTLRKP